jgi:hypothetical protein
VTWAIDRRNFIRLGLGAAGTLCFPLLSRAARAQTAASGDPHFFFQVIFQGGMDPTYLFDARPLAMTQAGIIQNYLGEDPKEWAGLNGAKSWATRLADPLKPYRDRFSVLNGVVMATGFDGHDQNMNFLLAGDPFGGESFVPHLNRYSALAPAPLDAVTQGFLLANVTNAGASVPLAADSAARLIDRLKQSAPLSTANPLYSFILSRMASNGSGPGAFSQGAQAMKNAYDQAPGFASMLGGIRIDPGGPQASSDQSKPSIDPKFLDMCLQLFKQGVTRSAVFVVNASFDAHDPKTASAQPATIGAAAELLAQVYKALAGAQFDGSRSFLDVTTVMASSEFGRTLRQKDKAMDETGTDHNPLSNTILVGGKGIRGGQVIGESDTRAAGEAVSKAHSTFDPSSLKMMGKPFDFASSRVRADLPAAYDPADYLGMASVANTMYSLFGVSKDRYRKLARNGADAPVVAGLLSI